VANPFDDSMAPLIKGMLLRGDSQSDIAACFGINSGRVAEVNTGQRCPEATAGAPYDLPPPPPYPSPYDLWKAHKALWSARVALEAVGEKIEIARRAVANAEAKVAPK
jgi:hypothetical protein